MGKREKLLRLDLPPPPSVPPPKVPAQDADTGTVSVAGLKPEDDSEDLAVLAAVIYREVWIEIRDILRERLAVGIDKRKGCGIKSTFWNRNNGMWRPGSQIQLQ